MSWITALIGPALNFLGKVMLGDRESRNRRQELKIAAEKAKLDLLKSESEGKTLTTIETISQSRFPSFFRAIILTLLLVPYVAGPFFPAEFNYYFEFLKTIPEEYHAIVIGALTSLFAIQEIKKRSLK